eukprot:s1826_g10.t1
MATDSPTPGTTDKGMQGGRPTGTRETVQARRALPLGALTSSRHLRRLEPVLREGRHISWRTKVSVVSALQQESQGLAILTAHGVSSAESRSKRVTLDPFAIAFDDNGWRGQFLRQGLESQGIYPSISFDRTRRPCIQSSTGIRCIVLRGNVTILSEKLAELRFVRRSNAEASSLEACQRRWERSSPQSREARPAESEELASDLRGGGVEGSVCSSEGCSAEESRHHAIGEGNWESCDIFLGFGLAFTSGLGLRFHVCVIQQPMSSLSDCTIAAVADSTLINWPPATNCIIIL